MTSLFLIIKKVFFDGKKAIIDEKRLFFTILEVRKKVSKLGILPINRARFAPKLAVFYGNLMAFLQFFVCF